MFFIIISIFFFEGFFKLILDLNYFRLRSTISDQLMVELGNGEKSAGLGRFINVIMLMPQLRELNDYWKRENIYKIYSI